MSTVDLRLLVVAADGTEPDLAAIRMILDYLGTPYTVHVAAHSPNGLTPDALSSGEHAFYQGIILTTGNLAYAQGNGWISALSPEEWHTLKAFKKQFGIRQVTWYTYPTPDYGFQPQAAGIDTSIEPILARFTVASRSVFWYVNTAYDLSVQGEYAYLAQPRSDERVLPLLVDQAGNALVLVQMDADGCQNLALTVDSNPSAIHTLVLGYGLVSWVTKGLFVGARHIYLSAQVDDMLISDHLRPASAPCDARPGAAGISYRMSGTDLQAIASWQHEKQTQPILEQFRLSFAFNGCGANPDETDSDTLIPEVLRLRDEFYWVSHTYDHMDMDEMGYARARAEIQRNAAVAQNLGLKTISPRSLVTPGMSGLSNERVLQAAHDSGVRYVVTDASRPDQSPPSPNTGARFNARHSSLQAIPRRPTNLYYDVTTPAEWVAEYNCRYAPHWGRRLSYDEILDKESQLILANLLRGDISPIMFHQSNVRAYDGRHSLLSDLVDQTLAKYSRLLNVPIVSLPMDDLGEQVVARMQYDRAGISASIVPGHQITVSSEQPATIPVTGMPSDGAASYGGQRISFITLKGGQSVTFPQPVR